MRPALQTSSHEYRTICACPLEMEAEEVKFDGVGAQELAYLSVSGRALASGFLESPNGHAIAIYIPSDTARIAAECRRKVPA